MSQNCTIQKHKLTPKYIDSASNPTRNSTRFTCFYLSKINNRVCKEIHSLGSMIDNDIKPVFTSRKLSPILSVKENKPAIVNSQWKYLFECNLCDANYVGYTLYYLTLTCTNTSPNIAFLSSGNILQHNMDCMEKHRLTTFLKYTVLKKCRSKYDCLTHKALEMTRLDLGLLKKRLIALPDPFKNCLHQKFGTSL